MKRLLFIVFLVAVSVSVSSCSKEKIALQKYLKEDTQTLIKCDPKKILADNFSTLLNVDFKEVTSAGGLLAILASPMETGVSVSDPFYLALDKSKGLTLVAQLQNRSKWEGFLQKNGISVEASSCKLMQDSSKYFLSWDDQVIKLTDHEQSFWQDKVSAVFSDPLFEAFENLKEQISFIHLGSTLGHGLMIGMNSPLLGSLMSPLFGNETIYGYAELSEDEIELTWNNQVTEWDVDWIEFPSNSSKLSMQAKLDKQLFHKLLSNNESLKKILEGNFGNFFSVEQLFEVMNGNVEYYDFGIQSYQKNVYETYLEAASGEYKGKYVVKEVNEENAIALLGLKEPNQLKKTLGVVAMFMKEDRGLLNFNDQFFLNFQNGNLMIGRGMVAAEKMRNWKAKNKNQLKSDQIQIEIVPDSEEFGSEVKSVGLIIDQSSLASGNQLELELKNGWASLLKLLNLKNLN